ncbi:MAG: tetratricopeptide repeat protein [Bryobacterales bacterium]|nr:tetratricopeptide repeat protein [Bryobacterales bacterium]
MNLFRTIALCVSLVLGFSLSVPAQPSQDANQPEFLRAAREATRKGDLAGALAIYQQELKAQPKNIAALNGAAMTLDLLGRTTEARAEFQKVLDQATNDRQRANVWRNIAMSYGFGNDCANATKYLMMTVEVEKAAGDAYQQGERANEAARICIEAGNFNEAERLYRMGTELGLAEKNISPARVALWNFRLEHALARIAIRRGNKAEAEKHVAAARALLDRNPEMAKDQEIFFPYLTGYVALWGGDYDKALADLSKANTNDPFIQCLMGMAYEKKGDTAKAREMYAKAAATTSHNPPAAFARPFATRKLAGN